MLATLSLLTMPIAGNSQARQKLLLRCDDKLQFVFNLT